MLTIVIPGTEMYDYEKEEFVYTEPHTIVLEHSLVSLSKWESKYHKPFLSKDAKTVDETIDYIKCMTITQNVPDKVYSGLTQENINQVMQYIEDPMTATWFRENKEGGRAGTFASEVITNELIYYWMVALHIPFECQKWHLNRLLTLIRVCNLKNQPDKKMSKQETKMSNAALNAARKKKLNTRG